MSDGLPIILFLASWLVLKTWVLPRLGVPS